MPMSVISGETEGLKSSQRDRLHLLFEQRVSPHEIVSSELALSLAELSLETSRQIGVMINRRGSVEHVLVGSAARLMLPNIGRARAGGARLRGLRLVHTHLRGEPLTPDDLTDLSQLRLDLVCAIDVRGNGSLGQVHLGFVDPNAGDGKREPWVTEELPGLDAVDIDPIARVNEIEAALGRRTAREVRATGRAILVGVALGSRGRADASMSELNELARTAGVVVVDVVIQPRPHLDSKFVVGRGKLDELNMRAMELGADLLIFDHDLTPAQARHIADHTSLKVIDRTQLILDIFAQHAHSAEGRVQVELAQLKYRLPRLVHADEGLSRLMGGIGGRGPGETKLEINRRRVRDRIHTLEKRIEDLSEKRQIRRQQRGRQDVPVLSIIGYTNAGKSTLLNKLTNSEVIAENKLFATLDPTSRRLRFPREREVVLTDTVGFIRDLPRTLVSAFRATLEELTDADLLLHVIDASDPEHPQHIHAVERVLSELELLDTPRLLVLNKCDLLQGSTKGSAARALVRETNGVAISAAMGEGLYDLLLRIEQMLWREGKALTPGGRSIEAETPAY